MKNILWFDYVFEKMVTIYILKDMLLQFVMQSMFLNFEINNANPKND